MNESLIGVAATAFVVTCRSLLHQGTPSPFPGPDSQLSSPALLQLSRLRSAIVEPLGGSMTMPASVPAMTAAPVAEAERYRRPPPAGPAIPRVRGIVRRIVRRVVGGRDVHGCRRDKRGFTRRCGRDVLGVGAVREAVILSGDFVLGSDSRNGGIVSVWIVTGARHSSSRKAQAAQAAQGRYRRAPLPRRAS